MKSANLLGFFSRNLSPLGRNCPGHSMVVDDQACDKRTLPGNQQNVPGICSSRWNPLVQLKLAANGVDVARVGA